MSKISGNPAARARSKARKAALREGSAASTVPVVISAEKRE